MLYYVKAWAEAWAEMASRPARWSLSLHSTARSVNRIIISSDLSGGELHIGLGSLFL